MFLFLSRFVPYLFENVIQWKIDHTCVTLSAFYRAREFREIFQYWN